ncbi:TPA: hypothetical protein GDO54_018491 [Pyxicephalus adspersus]|uniref:Uncharacterized protein n=1 Tax=Pyxicephalus adspersus TaxID=30357 RepID=A0AAV2ZME1_PYXAD|nr:TPA: hypothetical protein GDO54_018491 [Pyxicephalus adspersus]
MVEFEFEKQQLDLQQNRGGEENSGHAELKVACKRAVWSRRSQRVDQGCRCSKNFADVQDCVYPWCRPPLANLYRRWFRNLSCKVNNHHIY